MSRIAYIDDIEKWCTEFIFKQNVTVRFSETDMFGHVNNTIPFTYFEEARIGFLKSMGLMDNWKISKTDEIPVVADLQCDYLQQVYFGESLFVYVKMAKIGNSSFDLHYMIIKEEDGSICYTGRGTMVQISKETGKSIPWSEEVRKRFEESFYLR